MRSKEVRNGKRERRVGGGKRNERKKGELFHLYECRKQVN